MATKILLLGKVPAIMEKTLAELRAAGFEAVGTTSPETVHAEFDARDFGIIGLGGAFGDAQRQQLKAAFLAQNPSVQVLNLFAPVLLPQLRYLTNPPAGPPAVAGIEAGVGPEGLTLQVSLRTPTETTVTLFDYSQPLERETVFAGQLSAGPATWLVPRPPNSNLPHFVLVQTSTGEVHVHRFEA